MASIALHAKSTPAPLWQRARHSMAHFWPRIAATYVRDLWIRLPEIPGFDGKVSALTFDDGPTDGGTPRLLELLDRHKVRATFFLSGDNVLKHPRRAKEIVAAGHAVGNHFRRHIDCWKASPREAIREATEGSRIIEDVAGVSPAWCRPPYGRLTHSIVKWSRVHHQQIVLWNVFPPDYLTDSSPESLARVLLNRLDWGSIVCLHDNAVARAKTPAMLERVLPGLLLVRWSFVTLPKMDETSVPSARRAAA